MTGPTHPAATGQVAADVVDWIRRHYVSTGPLAPGELDLSPEQVGLVEAAYSISESGEVTGSWRMPAACGFSHRVDVNTLHRRHAGEDHLEDDVVEAGAELEDDEHEDDPAGEQASDATGNDLLDRIDALTGPMCVCGCRRRIKPNGASENFALPSCQRKWHSTYVDDPQQVYRRRDAARVPRNNDAAFVPLQEADGTISEVVDDRPTGNAGAVATAVLFDETRQYHGALQPPCPDPHGAAYRRTCPHCETAVIPQIFTGEPEAVVQFGDEQPHRFEPGFTRHLCPQCRRHLPPPAFLPDVAVDGDQLILELRDDSSRARQVITLRRLQHSPDPAALIRDTWIQMETQLGQFRRSWLGSPRR